MLAVDDHALVAESEADDYGYKTLLAEGYDPMAMSAAFAHLAKGNRHSDERGIAPFRDYFSSHPPIALREENYRERAKRWVAQNAEVRVYAGALNLRNKVPKFKKDYLQEYRP